MGGGNLVLGGSAAGCHQNGAQGAFRLQRKGETPQTPTVPALALVEGDVRGSYTPAEPE